MGASRFRSTQTETSTPPDFSFSSKTLSLRVRAAPPPVFDRLVMIANPQPPLRHILHPHWTSKLSSLLVVPLIPFSPQHCGC